jgi:hypothetical protein
LDDFDQREKDNNIVVTGLKDDQLTQDKVIGMLNDKLKKNIRKEDINNVMKLSNKRDGQPNRVRAVCNDKATKNDIMKQKTKLKNAHQQIWISDDLTKRRSDLAYVA